MNTAPATHPPAANPAPDAPAPAAPSAPAAPATPGAPTPAEPADAALAARLARLEEQLRGADAALAALVRRRAVERELGAARAGDIPAAADLVELALGRAVDPTPDIPAAVRDLRRRAPTLFHPAPPTTAPTTRAAPTPTPASAPAPTPLHPHAAPRPAPAAPESPAEIARLAAAGDRRALLLYLRLRRGEGEGC